jgi:predicted nuclease with TOPRIM domain
MMVENNQLHNHRHEDRYEEPKTRLERIEIKIDRLADEIDVLKVIQERMTNYSDVLKRYGLTLDDHEKRIRDLEVLGTVRGYSMKWVEQIIMIVIGGLIGYFINK